MDCWAYKMPTNTKVAQKTLDGPKELRDTSACRGLVGVGVGMLGGMRRYTGGDGKS